MSELTPDAFHRLLAAAAGLSPVRLQAALAEVDARPDWSERVVERLRRVVAGDNVQEVATEITFRGRPFRSDDRACLIRDYLSMFVDALLAERGNRAFKVLEVGCGAGAVITSLALETEGVFWGSDISQEAIDLARENAVALGAAVTFQQADLFSGLPGDFDVVFANIPYEAPSAELPEERWEPAVALYDTTGESLGLIRRLLRQLPPTVEALYMELPEDPARQALFAGSQLSLPSGEVVGIRMTRDEARRTLQQLDEAAAAALKKEGNVRNG